MARQVTLPAVLTRQQYAFRIVPGTLGFIPMAIAAVAAVFITA